MNISELKAGDKHYMAYVGPPLRYDIMGATQFRLLCTLGLRANDYLLDFGCGSLRAGKFFINYLDENRYYGVEPNQWLIEDAIKNRIGNDIIQIKKPTFAHNEDFSVKFDLQFDFILAQSIFSHTDKSLISVALKNFEKCLKRDGIIIVTFVEGYKDFNGEGWIYPGCVTYRPSTIKKFAKEVGLVASQIPWYHPNSQTWYVFAKDKSRLPSYSMKRYLKGAILFEPEFNASWKRSQKLMRYLKMNLPPTIKNLLKKWLSKLSPNIKERLGLPR
jgi:hypothetical protein